MKIKRILVLVFLMLFPDPVFGEASNPMREQVVTQIENHVTCFAYFQITETHLRNSDEIDLADDYSQTATEFLERAYFLSKEVEISEEALMAYVEYFVKFQLDEIDNDLTNHIILFNKYAENCKALSEDPDAIFSE